MRHDTWVSLFRFYKPGREGEGNLAEMLGSVMRKLGRGGGGGGTVLLTAQVFAACRVDKLLNVFFFCNSALNECTVVNSAVVRVHTTEAYDSGHVAALILNPLDAELNPI